MDFYINKYIFICSTSALFVFFVSSYFWAVERRNEVLYIQKFVYFMPYIHTVALATSTQHVVRTMPLHFRVIAGNTFFHRSLTAPFLFPGLYEKVNTAPSEHSATFDLGLIQHRVALHRGLSEWLWTLDTKSVYIARYASPCWWNQDPAKAHPIKVRCDIP